MLTQDIVGSTTQLSSSSPQYGTMGATSCSQDTPNVSCPPNVPTTAPSCSFPSQPPQPNPAAQQFCLRWNSYPATVATQLAALRASDDFVDVTLACEKMFIRAHKLVLSACSPYFMELIKSTPCKHPVIFLHDVKYRQLAALIEFMYAGEVNVSQTELPALLRTAEALQVRGLADTTSSNNLPPPPKAEQEFPSYQPSAPQPVMSSMFNPPAPTSDQNSNSVVSSCGDTCTNENTSTQGATNDPVFTSTNNNNILAKRARNDKVPCSQPNSVKSDPNGDEENSSESNGSFDDLAVAIENEAINNIISGNTLSDEQVRALTVIENQQDSNENEDNGNAGEEGESSEEEEAFELDRIYSNDNAPALNPENNTTPLLGTVVPNSGDLSHPPTTSTSSSNLPEGLTNLLSSTPEAKTNLTSNPLKLPGGKNNGPGGSTGRNRLSRALWPPGIPYHGPQQCPYCPRVLSNVGNWRKHVLTMHFAREKVYKCRHCASSFRTAEYLQKHYVRVHNYPQKLTRKKFVEQT